MKVGFYLNTPNNPVSALRAIIRHKGQRYTISIGESVIPKYWNEKSHRCRTVRDYPEASHINTRLDDWAGKNGKNDPLKTAENDHSKTVESDPLKTD